MLNSAEYSQLFFMTYFRSAKPPLTSQMCGSIWHISMLNKSSTWQLFRWWDYILINYMASYVSKQDETNPALLMATRAGKVLLFLSAHWGLPARNGVLFSYDKSFIHQACLVETAGFWPHSFFTCWRPSWPRAWPITHNNLSLVLSVGIMASFLRVCFFSFSGDMDVYFFSCSMRIVCGSSSNIIMSRCYYTWPEPTSKLEKWRNASKCCSRCVICTLLITSSVLLKFELLILSWRQASNYAVVSLWLLINPSVWHSDDKYLAVLSCGTVKLDPLCTA